MDGAPHPLFSLSNEEKGHVHSNGWLYVIADLVASTRRFLRNHSQALSFTRWWVNKPFSIDKDLPFRAAKGESRRGWRLVAATEIEMKSCLLLQSGRRAKFGSPPITDSQASVSICQVKMSVRLEAVQTRGIREPHQDVSAGDLEPEIHDAPKACSFDSRRRVSLAHVTYNTLLS